MLGETEVEPKQTGSHDVFLHAHMTHDLHKENAVIYTEIQYGPMKTGYYIQQLAECQCYANISSKTDQLRIKSLIHNS